jgi:CheY-like chemotaxis protein
MTRSDRPTNRRVLLVEDDFNIADTLAMVLRAHDLQIAGPVGTVKDALALIAGGERIDGAVLDINLRDETVYPVADVLRRKGIPIVFTTGYDDTLIAPDYSDVPSLQKPTSVEQLIQALFG